MTTSETITTAKRHGLTIPAFATDEHAPGHATHMRGWSRAVQSLDKATDNQGRATALKLLQAHGG